MTCSRPSKSVHPRACGEQFSDLTDKRHLIGSSPRVRGTVFLQEFLEFEDMDIKDLGQAGTHHDPLVQIQTPAL